MITFEKIREHKIPTLQAVVEEFVERVSGARHIHLSTQQPDLAFLVAFPTVPDCSDGRAHILEHLALCGSQRYPVRDPFFAMMRRSTANFMNAMTYADRTVYPFASTDRNDFFNLLDVYLDATFFPNLDYLNFRQEGWRYTLQDGKLGYQGVVFNEMKGAFSDPMQSLYSGISAALLTGTTYEVVSGGDPLAIPDLTHDDLKAFHANHYHPSQAMFMTAGAIRANEIQHEIIERVLSRFSGNRPRLLPQLATTDTPRKARINIPSQTAAPDEFGIQVAWLMGASSDVNVYHNASLLQAGLLGDASAPLRKYMESTGFGRPSRLNGMDPGARQMLFHVGMEGLTESQTEIARAGLWDAMEQAADQGVPLALLRAALRNIKYDQRDTSSGRMPNVLTRMLSALPVAMRGGDVMQAFDGAEALDRLEGEIEAPDFFQRLVRNVLDTPARLDAVVVPDIGYFTAREQVERERLEAASALLDDSGRARIEADNAALAKLQNALSATHLLPRIAPSDVSKQPRALPVLPPLTAGKLAFEIASNGLSYARIQFNVSALPAESWPWLQLYVDLRRDLGVDRYDYEAADVWRSTMVPAFSIELDADQDLGGALQSTLVFFASALQEQQRNIADVLQVYIDNPRFDEHPRIAFLVRRMVRERLQDLGQDGDRMAALAASAPLSAVRNFENTTQGVGSLSFLGELERLAASDEGVADIAARLMEMHAQLVICPASLLCAGSGETDMLTRLITLPSLATSYSHRQRQLESTSTPLANIALHAPGQVNHCHITWRGPQMNHPDAAALAVAGELMTNQLLHAALRERGGAYGGSASYAGSVGLFSMSSYRDPRLEATYTDFQQAIDHLLEGEFSTEQIEEAIICVVKGLDRPVSPFDGAVSAWRLGQRGIDEVVRQQFRNAVLQCTLADIKAAVNIWLQKGCPSRAAFVGSATQALAGLELVDLLELARAKKN